MPLSQLGFLTRRDLVRVAVVATIALAAVVWLSVQLLQPTPPRRVMLASGPASGLYHRDAQRYKASLARHGVTVEERASAGAAANLALLLEPASGVDVAFVHGGVVPPAAAERVVMLASLYYEPLWVFHRGPPTLVRLNQLRGRRIATGARGGGTHTLLQPLLASNGILPGNSDLRDLDGPDALRALQQGAIDAAMFVGGTQTPVIQEALRDPGLVLLSFERAAAYERRFPFIVQRVLPAGAIDFARNIPERDVNLIATKAMLVAREGLHPALGNLLVDAVRDVHDDQGIFESAGEFPGFAQVDIPVSPETLRHHRYGPSLLHRYLPFWVATLVERTVVLVVPLLVVILPALNYLPRFVRWRVRSRAYRYYGELALLERDVATRQGDPPIERWLADLDRIERAVADVPMPPSFASEAYTLREHVALVRRAVMARSEARGIDDKPPRRPSPHQEGG
jgi:TRAP-type uncharacterized transport system substrate-binding protein